jgi:ParB-like chromosome segregation protein Spo0J
MKWTTQRRKIKDLVPYPTNPRQMTDKQNKDLTASLKKFDLVEIPAVNTDGTILAGHQRLRIMSALGRGEEEIDVRVPDRLLTEKEVQEYNIRSNKNTGEWNMEELANSFEVTDLIDWGFDEKELKMGDIDFDNIEGNENRENKSKDMMVTCPDCGKNFNIKV